MAAGPRITVIGAGRLGEALIRGLLDAGAAAKGDLRATVASSERANLLRERYGVLVSAGANREAVASCDIVVLGVKPGKVDSVLSELAGVLRVEQKVVSMAGAVPLSTIERSTPPGTAVFRAMPNIAMTVGESATALCENDASTSEARCLVGGIFGTVGSVEWVDEPAMDAVTALSGSGVAFVFHALGALTEGGKKAGLEKDAAYRLARQTLLGAARLAAETELSPKEWIDQVKTPGGTTVAGLSILERRDTREAFVEAVESAARRAAEIQKELAD